MKNRVPVTLVLVAIASSGAAVPCTNVFTSSDNTRLAASNLDCNNYFPRVWFVPPAESEFGRFCFGTDKNERIAEGGMNDRGLFIAVNALDRNTGWKADPNLPDWTEWEGWFESGVPDGILAKCQTVDEAIEVFKGFNLFTLANVKFLIADAGGDSVIVEWSADALRFVRRGESTYQVSTNFVTSDYAVDQVPCQRYVIADRMLSQTDAEPHTDDLRRILSATHLEFETPTVLSAICDLKTGEIVLYYFHYFDEPITFNLHRELKQGRHGYLLRDLAPVRPYVSEVYENFSSRSSK